VDFIIENHKGEAIGIEVKLSNTINEKDCINMGNMQEVIGSKYKKGIIFYTGNSIMQIRRNIWALPVNYLWER